MILRVVYNNILFTAINIIDSMSHILSEAKMGGTQINSTVSASTTLLIVLLTATVVAYTSAFTCQHTCMNIHSTESITDDCIRALSPTIAEVHNQSSMTTSARAYRE